MHLKVLVNFLILCSTKEACVPGSMFLVVTPLSQTQGRGRCVEQGGDIAVVDTPDKVRAAVNVMDSVSDVDHVWIGLVMHGPGLFTWENGNAFSWNNWESTNQNVQPCVRLNHNGKWKSTDCDHIYPTLCMTDGSMSHNHMVLDIRHVSTTLPSLEKIWTVSLLDCVTHCSRRCPGCSFLLYFREECRLYDDLVTRDDFNMTSPGTVLYVSEMSEHEAVQNLAMAVN